MYVGGVTTSGLLSADSVKCTVIGVCKETYRPRLKEMRKKRGPKTEGDEKLHAGQETGHQ